MGFINPYNLPGNSAGYVTPPPGADPGLEDALLTLTPQALAGVAEALVETVLFGGPLFEAQTGLNPDQLSLFLKNIFQMPNELQQFLAFFVTQDPTPTQEIIRSLLTQNPSIPLSELQKVLTQKVRQGELQLAKILQSAQMTYTRDSRQMGDLLSTVSQIGARAASSPANSLAMTMLLYLPWYPLSLQQKFHLHSGQDEDKNQEGQSSGGGDQGEHLIMLIETNHIGRFRITASLLHVNQIDYHIQHGPEATAHLADIEQRLRDAMKTQQLMSAVFEFDPRNPPSWTPEPPPPSRSSKAAAAETDGQPHDQHQPKVAMRALGGPSLQLAQGAYMLMRVIFETDNRMGLQQQRAQNAPA